MSPTCATRARRMAGKCNFLTGRLFGKVGRAPLKAAYARAHSRAALWALLDIASHCQPMRTPRELRVMQFAIIYTDAHCTANNQHLRASDSVPTDWSPIDFSAVDNGFGAVIFPPGEHRREWFFSRRVTQGDPQTVQLHNTALIYLAWVALLAPLVFAPLLRKFYMGYRETPTLECPDQCVLDVAQPEGRWPSPRASAREGKHLRPCQPVRSLA